MKREKRSAHRPTPFFVLTNLSDEGSRRPLRTSHVQANKGAYMTRRRGLRDSRSTTRGIGRALLLKVRDDEPGRVLSLLANVSDCGNIDCVQINV